MDRILRLRRSGTKTQLGIDTMPFAHGRHHRATSSVIRIRWPAESVRRGQQPTLRALKL
jgi:hypothetical protein